MLETILAALGDRFVIVPGKSWLRVLRHTPWSATTVIVVLALVAAGGFLLAVFELRRWRTHRVQVSLAGGLAEWWVVRRSFEAHLARWVRGQISTSHPRIRIAPKGQDWRVNVVAREPPSATTPGPPDSATGDPRPALLATVEEVTRQGLARFGVPRTSQVRVRLVAAHRLPGERGGGTSTRVNSGRPG